MEPRSTSRRKPKCFYLFQETLNSLEDFMKTKPRIEGIPITRSQILTMAIENQLEKLKRK